MSYNIDTWKTKKLDNLRIPLNAFYKHSRSDWHPQWENVTNDPARVEEVQLRGYEFTISGKRQNGVLHIEEINISGEASGTFYNWILEPALRESKGQLEAVLIWAGGDAVTRLVVKDGQVTNTDIEL